MGTGRKLIAFLVKDAITSFSYKLSFVFEVLEVLFMATVFFFLGKLFGKVAVAELAPYGGDYFPFVLIGLAASNLFSTALSSVSGSLAREQAMGTLEAILVTPTRPGLVALALPMWSFVQSLWGTVLYMLFGVLMFGVKFHVASPGCFLVVFILSLVGFYGLGLVSAGFILVFKRGDPLSWLLGTVTSLLAGVYFPVTVLPRELQVVSRFLPMTYALETLRLVVLKGAGWKEVGKDLAALVLLGSLLLAAGVVLFKWAFRRARRDGSLAYY